MIPGTGSSRAWLWRLTSKAPRCRTPVPTKEAAPRPTRKSDRNATNREKVTVRLAKTIHAARTTVRVAQLLGAAASVFLLANARDDKRPATDTAFDKRAERPLTFQYETSVDGHDFISVRAAGNHERLLTSQVYLDSDSAPHAVELIIEAVRSNRYAILDARVATSHTARCDD